MTDPAGNDHTQTPSPDTAGAGPAGSSQTDPNAPGNAGAEGQGSGTEQAPAMPDKQAAGVPEKYEFKAPEGFHADEKEMGAYQTLAREAGLSQEQFQKITDFGVKHFSTQLEKSAQAQTEQRQKWTQEILNDRTLSDGHGLNPEAREAADRVISQYGGEDGGRELRRALNETGAGDNPAVIRAFVHIGKAMQLAGGVNGSGLPTGRPTQGGKSNTFEGMAERLFGSKNK